MREMETNVLGKLVGSAEVVGYELPPELVDAWNIYLRTKALVMPEPQPLGIEAAAARIVSSAASGEDPDLSALVREVDQSNRDRHATAEARRILDLAHEQAANAATNLASDLTERIITDHLRPAFDDVHEQARKYAATLAGYGSLDPYTLITAPAKARNAYAELPGLVERRLGIFAARRWVNIIGHREPQHDVQHMFGEFADPLAFHPTWRPPAKVQPVPAPEDPIKRLMWVVSDEAAPGKLWLPTVAEQDAAWQAKFGEAQTRRRNAHDNTVAIAGG